MSHLRPRKLNPSKCDKFKAVPQSRGSVSKESGDALIRARNHTTESRSKLPKSLKYDLDNALHGLCDVWFEEIKPHLLRNNIKVHVLNNSENCVEGGDHGQLQATAPGCSHLDPGADTHRQMKTASCADCCSMRQTASKVLSPKRQALPLSSAPRLHVHSTMKPAASVQNHCHINHWPPLFSEKPRKRVRGRRTKKQPQLKSQSRVPRICQTYCILSNNDIKNQPRRVPNYDPTIKINQSSVMKSPNIRNSWQKNSPTKQLPTTHDKSVQTEWDQSEIINQNRKDRKRIYTKPANKVSKQTNNKNEKINHNIIKDRPLLPDDVVDIIAHKYEKKIEILYHSPHTDDNSSILNLAPSTARQKKPKNNIKMKKKIAPWK